MGVKLKKWVGEAFLFGVGADSPKGGLTGGIGAVVRRESDGPAKVVLAVP